MSINRPKFLQVLPDDNGRVGFDGANVLALMRYMTALDGEYNGRVQIDGATWWRASHAEIAAALGGMSRDSVGRTVRRLEFAGELIGRSFPDGDQARAYRVPDQPECENAPVLTSQSAKTHRTSAKSHGTSAKMHSPECEIALSSSTGELVEVREGEEERVPPPPGGGVTGALSLRSFAAQLVGQIWPPGLDGKKVGIALSIVTNYLKERPDEKTAAAIAREALRRCPPDDPTRLRHFISQVAARSDLDTHQDTQPEPAAESSPAEFFEQLCTRTRTVASERLDVVDVETVEDAAAGPPCDVCGARPAAIVGKCQQCWAATRPVTPAPVDPEEVRRQALAALEASPYWDGGAA